MPLESGPETLEWKRLAMESAASMGIPVSSGQADRFSFHAVELLQWNRKMNLTAITDPAEVAIRHFLDSITAAPLIPAGSCLLDIGSGGGFPGIPLKVMIPSLKVVLVDSVRKKASFLNYLIGRLGLKDIRALHGRAQEMARDPSFAGAFDVVVCRALADLENLLRLSLPFINETGSLIAFKGENPRPELESLHMFKEGDGYRLLFGSHLLSVEISPYRLPHGGPKRTLVIFRKEA